jgi:genome maintenance exonuclease 1
MERLRKRGGRRGDGFHSAVEALLKGTEEPPKNLIALDLYRSSKPLIQKHVSNPLLIEQQLWSEDLEVAGTLDLLADWDGVPSLIDWKTSSYKKAEDEIETYFMQTFMYNYMLYERVDLMIKQIVIFIAVEHDDPQIFITTPNKHAKKTIKFLQEYRKTNRFQYIEKTT